MGQATARALGADMDLLLTGNDQARLDRLAFQLKEEGYTVKEAIGGSLENPATFAAISNGLRDAGEFGALIHTAGVSPALSDWKKIITVNLVATELLLRAVEPYLVPGSVAVLISSMAAYMAAADPELDAILAHTLDVDLLKKAEPLLEKTRIEDDEFGLGTQAYLASKREVVRICERRAREWGLRGARIVSISPGMIWTPMARKEVDDNPMPRNVLESTPIGRWGTPMDIAAAARFLVSESAGFITGCDLRVDGGVTPAMLGPLL
jgi:NAD(P)-dependent dehydrogenase (short-subunit alcohol dehydrogenase family)